MQPTPTDVLARLNAWKADLVRGSQPGTLRPHRMRGRCPYDSWASKRQTSALSVRIRRLGTLTDRFTPYVRVTSS